ncbi:MAG: biosynthetic-type acetolactate synthase large subunit [Spirochaetaceae bacterium]|jgi:acetolactate synthase-1/2/3 large subunit|nr:biosynthetic-type acetolactate synthase large subunit [Spirochaetaceae bacterium]
MQYTGARILVEALIEQGVDTIFGYPGGAVLFIYDELYRQKDRIRHILVSHEQHAVHAADGYARSTGKVGVCIATSGPGATNLVTGIATAAMDSTPLVAITGNVGTALLGKDSFQEVDITGITMPMVKHNWIVKDVQDLAEVVREAFLVAVSGRPGPVLIDLPRDVSACMGEWTPGAVSRDSVRSPRAARFTQRFASPTFTEEDINRAVAMLTEAKQPVIYAGGGVILSGASEELRLLAERLHAPVSVSLMGVGAMPYDHPLHTGLLGMHGTVASNRAVQQGDLLIAIGARFSDRVTSSTAQFARNAQVLHFDIDPAEVNKNVEAEAWVVGDIQKTLTRVLEKLPSKRESLWNGDIAAWKALLPPAYTQERSEGLHPRFIIQETARALGTEALVVTDVGQHQMWAAQFYPITRPRTFLSSGGLGTMGFGLGAAEGAKIANPGKPVVLFTGDGSFRMNCAEMGTLAAYGIPVLILVLNNHVLGMVRQWQTLFYEKRYAETVLDRPPDFVKLAEAYGLRGFRVATKEEFRAALDKALGELQGGRGVLLDAFVHPDEQVLPMVPGGKPLDEQIL